MKNMSLADFHAVLKAQGVPRDHLAFRCPMCQTVQSANDLITAGSARKALVVPTGGSDGIGAWGSAPLVRTYEEEVIVVRIDLFDSRDGQPVWSSQAEMPSGGSQSERVDALRGAIQRAMSSYPPA